MELLVQKKMILQEERLLGVLYGDKNLEILMVGNIGFMRSIAHRAQLLIDTKYILMV